MTASSVIAQVGDFFLLIAAVLAVAALMRYAWGMQLYLFSRRSEIERAPGRFDMILGFEYLFLLFVAWVVIHWIVGLFN